MNKLIKSAYATAASARVDSKLRELCATTGLRADAGEVVHARGSLEAIEQVIYNELFSENLEGLSTIPTRSFDRAVQTYSYLVETKTGVAAVMRPDATDAPAVDASTAKVSQELTEFGAGYKYNVLQRERASAGFDLTASKARSAARAIAQALNNHAISGTADTGVVTGFTNDANVADATLTDADWTTITPAAMYSCLVDMVEKVINQSSALHTPTELLVSTFVWNKINATRLADGTAESVLEAFRKNSPGVSVSRMTSLTAAGTAGVDLAICWERSSAVAEHILPVMYEEAAADKKGFTYSVQARGSSFGTVVRYPLAMAYGQITIA